MKSTELKTQLSLNIPQIEQLEKTTAENLLENFSPFLQKIREDNEQYISILTKYKAEDITPELIKEAELIRRKISKTRIEAEKHRRKIKENSLLLGKAIDGVGNIIKLEAVEKEAKLKEIENHYLLLEAKKKDDLEQKRKDLLAEYIDDFTGLDLRNMLEDVFNSFLAMKQKQKEEIELAEKQARKEAKDRLKVEAEAKLEEERKARALALKKEEEYKAEKLAREKLEEELEKERRAKAEAGLKAKKQLELQEQAKAKAKAKIEAEQKARELAEQKVKDLEEKQARLQEEARAEEKARRARAEAKAKAEKQLILKQKETLKKQEEAKRQAELNKTDHQKVMDLMQDLEKIKFKYSFSSRDNQRMYAGIQSNIDELISRITDFKNKTLGTK